MTKETLRFAIVGRPSWERSNDNGRRREHEPYQNPDAADQDAVYDPAKL